MFRTGPAHVRVPATAANLGPGFDAVGLALALHDHVTARVSGRGIAIDVSGEGAEEVPRDEAHLVVRAMRAGFDVLGGQPSGVELRAVNKIPHGRGLGSSAAAIVAGVVLARELVPDGDDRLPDAEVLALASALEGHPDNVAACLFGGLTVAWSSGGRPEAVRLDCDPAIRPVVLISSAPAPTGETRKLLPAEVPYGDAAFNAGRAALLVAALTGATHALLPATDDLLHQPYRAPAMPETAGLVARLRAAGVPAVVSGAGPTVLALARDDDEAGLARSLCPAGWRAQRLGVDPDGARSGA